MRLDYSDNHDTRTLHISGTKDAYAIIANVRFILFQPPKLAIVNVGSVPLQGSAIGNTYLISNRPTYRLLFTYRGQYYWLYLWPLCEHKG